MKKLFTYSLVLAFSTVSCGTNPRVLDAAGEGCELVEAYNNMIESPGDENVSNVIYALQTGFKMTVESESLDLQEVKDVMAKQCAGNEALLDKALNVK